HCGRLARAVCSRMHVTARASAPGLPAHHVAWLEPIVWREYASTGAAERAGLKPGHSGPPAANLRTGADPGRRRRADRAAPILAADRCARRWGDRRRVFALCGGLFP